jgi:hypothetical protein
MKILLTYPIELECKVIKAMREEKAKSAAVAAKMDKSLKAKLLRLRIKDFHFNASLDFFIDGPGRMIVDMPLGFVEEWANPLKVVKTFQQELDKEFGDAVIKATWYNEGQANKANRDQGKETIQTTLFKGTHDGQGSQG